MSTPYFISVLFIAFNLLFAINWWGWKQKSDNPTSVTVQNGQWKLLHISHAGGIIIMMLVTILLWSGLPQHLLMIPEKINYLQIVLFILAVILILILTSSQKTKTTTPEISPGGLQLIFNTTFYIILRSVYLIFYEWFFRGCLLFVCKDMWSIAPAITINIVLYMLIHSFKAKKEWIGCIPFGLVLCGFTLWSQSIWPAILLHLLLSFYNESITLKQFFIKPLNYKI